MPDSATVTIHRILDPRIVLDFLLHARKEMFGERINPLEVPEDLANYELVYAPPNGCMLAAVDSDDKVQATIAYRAYDGRFPQLHFHDNAKIVEVVRLYVAPCMRRSGLATQLFHALEQEARADGCDVLYLHTHPFLEGALEFWQKCGFQIMDREEDPVWQTIHMQLSDWNT